MYESTHIETTVTPDQVLNIFKKHLKEMGVTATFITNDIAVVTDTGYGSRLPQPLIILTATTPTGQNLTGHSYTIDTVKPGGGWEPATVTFKV